VPVLMYHRVGPARGPWEKRYCIQPGDFQNHIQALQNAGYVAVSLEAFSAWLSGERGLPKGALLVTFDDGFMGVHDHAAPILAAQGWPATMFLVSGLVGGRDEWSLREHPEGKTYPLMGWPEVRALGEAGWDFGSHSVSHGDLTTLDDDALTSQLQVSRQAIAEALGKPVSAMAYPYGRHDDRVCAAAQAAGYSLAFSTRSGFNRAGENPLSIRRLEITGADSPSALLRKIRLGSNDGSLAGMARYYASRILAR
jgi:peptidoglycan/xylan/chitin deacetylase (PgdA/CDA1 family)